MQAWKVTPINEARLASQTSPNCASFPGIPAAASPCLALPHVRDALLAGSSTAAQQQRAKETEATAELDNKGLVQLQQQIMQQQDHELEHMEKTVISTKVILQKRGAGSCFFVPVCLASAPGASAAGGERASQAKGPTAGSATRDATRLGVRLWPHAHFCALNPFLLL